MSTETKYDVFISYSRKDYVDEATKQVISGNVVSQIKEMFDANGISYWFDEDGIYSGDAFAPLIAKNIKSAKIFLFISSKNSNASEWTSNEIATAHAYKKKIIPFRYDDSVYNDSVIIYIARLDYIEYQSNPSKALSRLLSSIQTYLKSEKDREEKEKEAEERRLNEEKSKQEQANKLQQIREQIENLETRKYQIEQEISEQEKALSGLRNEKRIVEDKIENLRIERFHLLGYQHVDEKKKPEKPKDDEQNSFFVREWKKLKEAMSLKHWIVNAFLVILLVVALFFLSAFIADFYNNKFFICALLGIISTLLSIISILRNKRNGLWWFVVSVIPTLLTDEEGYLLICMTAWIITSLMMFVRKNGRSAWSVVWNSDAKKRAEDKKINAFINRIKANRNVKWAVIISIVVAAIVVAASIMPILFGNDETEYQEVLFDTTCVAIDTCAVVNTVGYYDEYAEIYTINIAGYNGGGTLKPKMQYTLNLNDGGVENNCEFYLEEAPSGTRIEGNKLITGSEGGNIVICGKGDGFNVKPRTLSIETDVIPEKRSTKYNYDDTPPKK